jgi:hypothetical protein
VICVRLAAAIPLRKAGRIPPMQAIRNVELTRRLKRSRVQSRPLFDVPRHLARRNMTLYRSRQAGITAMLAVSIVLLSLAAFGARPILSESGWDYGWDYVLGKQSRMVDWLMEYELHRPGITEQDRADAAALAGVMTAIGEKLLQGKDTCGEDHALYLKQQSSVILTTFPRSRSTMIIPMQSAVASAAVSGLPGQQGQVRLHPGLSHRGLLRHRRGCYR